MSAITGNVMIERVLHHKTKDQKRNITVTKIWIFPDELHQRKF